VLSRVSLVLVLALMIAGCASTGWSRSEAVRYTKLMMVEIERYARGGDPIDLGYAHPARVSEEKVRGLFEALTYASEGERKLAVGKDSAAGLARAIVSGLARCDPASRVRFNVENPGEKQLILSSSTSTRGVAFVEPAGVLNVAFQVVDHLYGFQDDAKWIDPTQGPDVPQHLVLPESARFHVAKDGTVNTMWVTCPVGDTRPAKPAAVAAETPPAEPVPKAAPSERLTSEETLNRLRYLEELREKGMISEEKYREERKRLLAK